MTWFRDVREVLRLDLAAMVSPDARVLEIGPANLPTLKGPNVEYFDVLSSDELGIHIHHHSPTGNFSIIPDASFDIIFSAHCIEHQPDFVSHLQQARRMLRDGGKYLVVAPDHRYCFDHFIAPSSMADILVSHEERRTVHTLENFSRHLSMMTHNDAARHWAQDHGEPAGPAAFKPSLQDQFLDRIANGLYTDCHAWQFTPDTFQQITTSLAERGEIDFAKIEVSETPRNHFEFTAILST